MKTFLTTLALSVMFSGCMSGNGITIMTTNQWEGHYFTQEDAKNAVDNITLEENESVWIMSNRTLNTILLNLRKK